ncbi:MAG: corrinoid protein [Deltaproteobacteria bacterium]|nr:corrinoid protein [Deltaproteobacteria bacterium]
MGDYNKIMEAVIKGDKRNAADQAKLLLESGNDLIDVIENGLNVAMGIVGDRMKTGEMFIPEVLQSAIAMRSAVDVFKPHMDAGEIKSLGRVVLGSVKGDLHDIGKSLVSLMLEGAGFTVFDLGVDVEPERFVKAIKEHNAQLVGMSALLTTTMPNMERTVKAIKEAGLRDQVKIILGGAPINQKFADKIGADGYGENAGSAVQLSKSLLKI